VEEGLKHMRETEDLSNRNATLEKENMLSNSLIRSLRDDENRQLKFIDNLQYQIKLLKSDVNGENQNLEKLVKELKLKDGEICRLTQQTNELNDELKWANMLNSPSIHIFNLEPETTSDFLQTKFSEYGTVTRVHILQNPPTGEAFVTFEDPMHAQRACSVNGYKKWKIQLSRGYKTYHKKSQ
jgi:RNA recognition motif-containing protein